MSAKPAKSNVNAFRALLGGMVLTATVALVISAWLGRGFTIDSGSMAPAILGPHVDLECPECGLPFVVGVEIADALERPATCPNCGGPVERDPASRADGDGVLVDRRAFQFRAPRRYEVASLREPNRASQLCVKRVVGLPGERVAIREGDVYINGQLSRKGLGEQQAVALMVFDNAYRPDAASPAQSRWQPDEGNSRWRAVGSEFSVAAASDTDSPTNDAKRPAAEDWLSYRHLVRVGDSAEFVESLVLDTQGYNQTRPVADPHPVRDLALSLEVKAEGPGVVYLRARGARGSRSDLISQIDVITGACELRSEDQTLESRSGPALADGKTHALYFSLIDRQALLAIDGRVVFEYALDEQSIEADASAPSVSDASRPFAIASDCPALRIGGLKVLRDVYYTPVGGTPNSPASAAETQLAADEFYVLSDNSRLGFDSRFAGFGPAAPFNLFVGKPLTAYSRAPRSPGWWGGIQVPAVWRIRYIR